MRSVAVFGAGVIGQVYAGRLAEAGHPTWLVARGSTYQRLAQHGVEITEAEQTLRPPVQVVENPADVPAVDTAYIAIRADQVDQAMPAIKRINAKRFVSLINLGSKAAEFARTLGAERTVLAFPGIGGVSGPERITYHLIPQQPTMVGIHAGLEKEVAADLEGAGFPVSLEEDPRAWLITHVVFIAGVGAAILSAGGAEEASSSPAGMRTMVRSVRDGFRALARQRIPVTPSPLRTIFTKVPLPFAWRYWAGQLRGDLGTLSLAPHVLATRDTEFAALAEQVVRLTPGADLLHGELERVGELRRHRPE